MRTFFIEFYEQIYNIFSGMEYARLLLVLKLGSWVLSLFLLFLIFILFKRADAAWWLKEQVHAGKFVYGAPINQRWQKILNRLEAGDEANLKLAIIEADNLLDEILKRMSLPGKDFGERLMQFESHELKSINLVWEAHKLRNTIVHEPGVRIDKEQTEQAIKNYETAFKELEYLE
jgi:hypothetical protein